MRRAVVYALLVAFFAGEGLFRQEGPAASLRAEQSDRESTKAVGQAFGISIFALLAVPLLDARGAGTLPRPRALFRTGVAAMIAGLAIRVWAMRTLGAAYTRTLRLVEEQRVIREGPYRLIRHPGYLGTLLVWLGAAVALANGLVLPLVGLALLRAYGRRMRAEEAMLAETFGADYAAYMRRTWRLVPFVY